MKQTKKLTQEELVNLIKSVDAVDLNNEEHRNVLGLAIAECANIEGKADAAKVKRHTFDMLATIPGIMDYMTSPKTKRKTDPKCLHVQIYDRIILKAIRVGLANIVDPVTDKRVGWLCDPKNELSKVQAERKKHWDKQLKGSYVGNWRKCVGARLEKAEKKRAPRNEEKTTKATKAPAKVTKTHITKFNKFREELGLNEELTIRLLVEALPKLNLTKLGVATGELQSALDRLAHIATDIEKHAAKAIKETA